VSRHHFILSSVAIVLASATSAAAQQSAALSVGARVAPQCSINVEPSTTLDDLSPAVRVRCGNRGLRVLRVSTDRGDGLKPSTTFAGSQLRAGGEVVFVVAQPLATLASRLPVFAPPPQPDRKPVRVTLDF
jgi:hypothetical protein